MTAYRRLMRGKAILPSAGKPCVCCGARNTPRWVYAGQVYCIACAHRYQATA